MSMCEKLREATNVSRERVLRLLETWIKHFRTVEKQNESVTETLDFVFRGGSEEEYTVLTLLINNGRTLGNTSMTC